VLRIRADHAYHAFAVDDLAVITHLFYGSSYFHNASTLYSQDFPSLNLKSLAKIKLPPNQAIPPCPTRFPIGFENASIGKLRILTRH
jgi:hypothetical protein